MTNFAKPRADQLQERVAELNEIIRGLRGELASERATNLFLQTHTEHLETMLPLCAGHAESWYCCRDHLNGGMEQQCVVCAFVQPEALLTIEEAEGFAQAEVDDHKSRMSGLCIQLAEQCEKEAAGYLTKCPSKSSLLSRALAFRAAAHRIADKPHNVCYSAYTRPTRTQSPQGSTK